jgi:hypothetical protein
MDMNRIYLEHIVPGPGSWVADANILGREEADEEEEEDEEPNGDGDDNDGYSE